MESKGLTEDTGYGAYTRKWGIIQISVTVLITLAVFLIPYLLTRRAHSEKLRSTKESIVRTLAGSIAENNIPDAKKIQMIILGVCADNGVKVSEYFKAREIVDILQYRIMSNEFLDEDRKKSLSDTLTALREILHEDFILESLKIPLTRGEESKKAITGFIFPAIAALIAMSLTIISFWRSRMRMLQQRLSTS